MELSTPITIYWDLPSQAADICILQRICSDIIACPPLMLQLRDSGPALGAGTLAVLDRLRWAQIAVTLTVAPAALAGPAQILCRDCGLKEILLALEHPMEVPRDLPWSPGGGAEPATGGVLPVIGVSFSVSGENWRELPALISLCRERGITRVVLPMQRLYHSETPFLLNREEQRLLSGALQDSGGVQGLNLTIHDPFLWRAFNPALPFPQGGCQAANTMLAIAPDSRVYPCPTLPVPLGDASQTPLREIVASPAKKEFRKGLLKEPEACRGCVELADCRGGCRGRAYAFNATLESADPACA